MKIPYRGVYRSAFIQGYDYAYGAETYPFGENSEEEDYKNIPKCKNKKHWLNAWFHGCEVGAS